MNHELFSATSFELHQSIAQHLPSGFASGPVFDALKAEITVSMKNELFSATSFELHQSIVRNLPSGFASGPVFDAIQNGIKAVALTKKQALQYVCPVRIGVGQQWVELQFEVSHAGEIDALRVMVAGFNIVRYLDKAVIEKLDSHCLESYRTLYESGMVPRAPCL